MPNNKEIQVLSEKEHIRARPTVYVGSVKPTDERISIIRDGRIFVESRLVSIGLYKLFDEVFSNSLDEAKRMKGKMKSITVSINSKKNSVTIRDTGNGFYKGTSKNKISGLSNIETAVSQLRAGSNFKNDEVEESLIGTNGVGVSVVNVLSSRFSILTVNETHRYEQIWNDYERSDPRVEKNDGKSENGTEITFEPLPDVFGRSKWDIEILTTTLAFKKRLIRKDPVIKNLEIVFLWDEKNINVDVDIFPKDSFILETPIGEVIVWEKFDGGGSVSFVNSAICSGIHQRIINEYINEKLDDSLGHHFYDAFVSLNIPPRLVEFGDQNKTKFVTKREDIEPTISRNILNRLGTFFKTDLFTRILKKVEERRVEGHIKKLRAEKKKVNVKNSHKYFPASKSSAENLFIVEGLCIDENEKINVWRNGELMNLCLKEVLIGDEVITHSNRMRTITNKQRKLKECVCIKLTDGTIIKQPKTHKYYTFNSITGEFSFKTVDLIDIKYDNLVRSNLGNFIGTLEVADFFTIDNEEYPNQVFLEDGSYYQFSNSHKYCIYDINTKSFNMKLGKNAVKGDLFCLFDFI